MGQKVLAEHGLADQSNAGDGGGQRRPGRRGPRGHDRHRRTRGGGGTGPPKAGVAFIEATLAGDAATQTAFDTVEQVRDSVHAGRGRRRAGRRLVGDLPRHEDRGQPRQRRDHPDRAGGGAADPDAAAARARLAADPDRDGGAVLRRGTRHRPLSSSSTCSATRARIRRFPLFVFVFLVALGHRLQHLPDDPGPGGDDARAGPARARWWP